MVVVDARVAGDVDGDDVVRVVAQHARDGELADVGRHGHGVVAWSEGEVVEEGLADGGVVDREVEGEVALGRLLAKS